MKKLINLFVIPLIAGFIIVFCLHTLLPQLQRENSDMLGNNTDIAIGLMGFLFGFLPVFIRNIAIITLQSLRPVPVVEVAQVDQVADQVAFNDLPLQVGMSFTSAGSNCRVRVKSLNISAILEYNNPGYLDLI